MLWSVVHICNMIGGAAAAAVKQRTALHCTIAPHDDSTRRVGTETIVVRRRRRRRGFQSVHMCALSVRCVWSVCVSVCVCTCVLGMWCCCAVVLCVCSPRNDSKHAKHTFHPSYRIVDVDDVSDAALCHERNGRSNRDGHMFHGRRRRRFFARSSGGVRAQLSQILV